MGLKFKIILTSCRYGLKMDEKSNYTRKQVYLITKYRAGNLVRIRFSELILGLVWIINCGVLEEIGLVMGFIDRKAVCHAEEILVLRNVKPSLMARSIF